MVDELRASAVNGANAVNALFEALASIREMHGVVSRGCLARQTCLSSRMMRIVCSDLVTPT